MQDSVKFSEIEENDYNLNIPRYVTPEDKEIQQDIYAHLHGGLPAHDVDVVMSSFWEACPTLKDNLFKKEANGYYSLVPDVDKISDTINNDPSYIKQNELYAAVIEKWCKAASEEMFTEVKEECEPKALIAKWGEMLLAEARKDLKLVAPYNVYEILMNYWAETMQDDCYMVSRDGWKVNLVETKKKSTFEDMECDLLPVPVVVNEYYTDELGKIVEKRSELEQINAEIEAVPEDNADAFDEGLYEMLEKVNEANVKKAVAAAKKNLVDADSETVKVWNKYLELCSKKKEISKDISALVDDMTNKVKSEYSKLTPDDVKALVIEKKWIAEIKRGCISEIVRVSESISNQTSLLNRRYAIPLPKIEDELREISAEVNGYLISMGIK